MKIRNISVTGLFGLFNHVIPLQSTDRVTIIHSPNGYGKTVMLRMIASLIEGRTAIFERTPFETFCVKLEDGSARTIERHIEVGPQEGKPRPRLEYSVVDSSGNKQLIEPTSLPPDIPFRVLAAVDREIPTPFRLTGTHWVDADQNSFSLADILEKFPDAKEKLPKKYRPGFLFDISRDLDVFVIETNRLDVSSASSRSDRHRSLRADAKTSSQIR